MSFVRNTIVPLLLISLTTVSFGQLGSNFTPQIIGQTPLSTNQNVPITIELGNLIVLDVDDVYPFGFTLKVYDGENYSVQDLTVAPDKDFHGTLTVQVTVNDGEDESKKFDLKIKVNEVDNVRPVITGQMPSPLLATSGEELTIELSHLIVVDPDNKYPEDFTLEVSSGENYDRDDNTITPDDDFVGTLTVPVRVDDGNDESERFNLKIDVSEPNNSPPIITGQDELSTNEDQSITIQLDNLEVTDPDNDYPKGFTLKIPQGNGINYSVSGKTIIPAQNFTGALTVAGVTVNDGKNESNAYPLVITVKPVNDAPVINGQHALTTYINTPITILFENLLVTDPDNNYPNGFTLKISQGFNYSVAGNTITPGRNFQGTLKVKLTVNDGTANSNTFELQIRVIEVANVAPVITGQDPDPIPITVNSPLEIRFNHLKVSDPDNNTDYPSGFSLAVLTGLNYTVSGAIITPATNFTGTLSVRVSVNDGRATSNIFNLQVAVDPESVNPQIIGQKPLVTNEDQPITIQLTDLIVSDADDEYPEGFTLTVLPGKDYTANKNTVTPALNRNGFLAVGVTVTDNDKNPSAIFNLAILINPVNDAPVITQFENTPLSYEPGADPIALTAIFEVEDVDNDHLSFAEIGLDSVNYSKGFDELLFNNTTNIRGVFDMDEGKLSLIGYATLPEYKEAIHSIKYNYRLSEDENGNQAGIIPDTKTILLRVHDGQQYSGTRMRNIVMEVTVSLNIPTAFTPNGDGPNETWNINALSNAHQCDEAVISVYDKRGLLLFQSIGLEKKWDGKFRGEVLPMDTYYYTINLNLSYTKKTYKGVVTILR